MPLSATARSPLGADRSPATQNIRDRATVGPGSRSRAAVEWGRAFDDFVLLLDSLDRGAALLKGFLPFDSVAK
jgi:hypothetical protein